MENKGFTLTTNKGSVLLGALALILVVTILGFGLFDLAVVESRLGLYSEAEYCAFEAAQAGIERTLHQLVLDFCGGNPTCSGAPPSPSWADGTINGTGFSPTTTTFANFLLDQTFVGGGTYTVQLKNLTNGEANGLGMSCNAALDTDICPDVIYVRSTGACTKGVAVSNNRTIQVLAQGRNQSPFANGLTAGRSANTAPITGSAKIAGSITVLGCDSCLTTFGGNAGQRNNYNDMPASLQRRVPLLDRVCPAGSLNCADSAKLESLRARTNFAHPQTVAALELSGAASLGTSATTNNPFTGNAGKPKIDEVRIGDGCSTANCSDAVVGAAHVYSDSGILEFRIIPDPVFPLLTDPVTIKDVLYAKYADCSSVGVCNNPPGSGEFFISHAFKIDTTTYVDGQSAGCVPKPKKLYEVACNLFNILTARTDIAANLREQWDNDTPSFTKTFTCGATCDDTNGNRVNGSINGSKPTSLKINWDKASQNLSILCSGAPSGGCSGAGGLLSHDTNPVLPILVYVDGALKICEGCNNKEFFYQGKAIFLAKGEIRIDSSLLTVCGVSDLTCATADPNSFPQKHLLGFLTPSAMNIGLTSNRDMLGVFYSGDLWTTTKQTNIVGAMTAARFDMGNQVPSFFQVPKLAATLPETLFPPVKYLWRIELRNWKECQGAVSASSPCTGVGES